MEISDNKGHYWPEETTNERPTWINAEACTLLKLIINKRYDSIETGHVLFMLRIVLSFHTNMHQGSGIDPELITILAFLVKDSPEML